MLKVECAYLGKIHNTKETWIDEAVMNINDIDDALIRKYFPINERCKLIKMMDHSSLKSAATSYEKTARYCLERAENLSGNERFKSNYRGLGSYLLGQSINYQKIISEARKRTKEREAELPDKLKTDFDILDQLKKEVGF